MIPAIVKDSLSNMVNKQYTVQNVIRKSPTEMVDGNTAPDGAAGASKSSNRNDIAVISRIPNPQQKYSSNLSTDVLKSSHAQEIQPGVFGRNLAIYNDDEYAVADNDDDRGSNETSKEMCISDIGRFQYILQMDREMVSEQKDGALCARFVYTILWYGDVRRTMRSECAACLM